MIKWQVLYAAAGSRHVGTPPPAAISLYAAPPVQAAVPFSRPRRDPPPTASTAQPAPHGPVPPFSRPRRDPPPPPLFQAAAPLSGGCDVQSGPGQQPHRKRRREGTPQAQDPLKCKQLPESRGDYAEQGTVGGVSIAFGAHGGLQAAAQAVASSNAPAQSAAMASGGAALAQAGSVGAVQSTGLADAALSGTTLSPSASRFAASSFGSSKVQAAVKGTAEGVKSSYIFSF
ncbi:hypothetical protein ABBQ38_012846 [Trebouxia sp. C0009 RCD-2024]